MKAIGAVVAVLIGQELLAPSVAVAQSRPQLVPLATYINAPIEKDPAALAYLASRCSALYSIFAVKLEPETDPERQRVMRQMIATAEAFMGKAVQLNMTGTTLGVKEASAATSNTVVGLGKLYSDRIESQKLLTSNMFDDELIATDFDVCKSLAAKGLN
jgi:hypothetical protein